MFGLCRWEKYYTKYHGIILLKILLRMVTREANKEKHKNVLFLPNIIYVLITHPPHSMCYGVDRKKYIKIQLNCYYKREYYT